MGLEHEFEDILEDALEEGLEKGIVKAVEKLINKGLIKEIIQITINTIEENILILAETGLSAAAATVILSLRKSIQEIIKVSSEEMLPQIKNLVFNLIKNMYGDISEPEVVKIISEIKNVDKLCLIMQIVIDSKSLETLIPSIKIWCKVLSHKKLLNPILSWNI